MDIKYNKLASVESFDPESGEWSEEPPMLTARSPSPNANAAEGGNSVRL